MSGASNFQERGAASYLNLGDLSIHLTARRTYVKFLQQHRHLMLTTPYHYTIELGCMGGKDYAETCEKIELLEKNAKNFTLGKKYYSTS